MLIVCIALVQCVVLNFLLKAWGEDVTVHTGHGPSEFSKVLMF